MCLYLWDNFVMLADVRQFTLRGRICHNSKTNSAMSNMCTENIFFCRRNSYTTIWLSVPGERSIMMGDLLVI